MEDDKVKQLAETLYKQGLAASMYEAVEKAKSILDVKIEKNEVQQETEQNTSKSDDINKEDGDRFSKSDYDVQKEKVSLNELMGEVGVSQDQVETQENEKIDKIKEEINVVKKEIRRAEENPEKAEHIKEEISKVNEEINEIMETKSDDQQTNLQTNEAKEEDKFKDEKNIDLTEIFNYKK